MPRPNCCRNESEAAAEAASEAAEATAEAAFIHHGAADNSGGKGRRDRSRPAPPFFYCIAIIMSNQPFYEVMKWYDILVNIVKVLRFNVLVGSMPHAPLV